MDLKQNLADGPGVDSTDALAEVRAMQKVLADGGGARAASEETALKALRLVDSLPDMSRLSSVLVQLLRHPSPQVRSKATLLMGRANLNLNRVREFLQASDPRTRANAVESLWDHALHANVRQSLWEAVGDRHGRVMVNALLGLCKGGDRRAFTRLGALAESADPAQRVAAAWAMGETTAWEFDPVLEKLAQDPEEKVRSMAERSRKKLEPPPAPAAPEATASPDAASTPETAPAPEAAPAAPETAS